MKFLSVVFLLIFSVSVCFSQTNRFTRIQGLRSTYGLETDVDAINRLVRNSPECQTMKYMATSILKNMAKVANEPFVVKFYRENGLHFSHTFDNSSWVKKIEFFDKSGLMNGFFTVMTTIDGNRYFYPNVPKQVYYKWQFSKSPGKYYQRKVKKYSLGSILSKASCL